jgi:hypothetical protein
MEAGPRETGWTDDAGAHLSTRQAAYRGELFYELLPERDPVFRHLGAVALALTLSGSGLTPGLLLSDDLPSFEAYVAVKYPDLPPEAAAELVRRFHQLAEIHGIAEDLQPSSARGSRQ